MQRSGGLSAGEGKAYSVSFDVQVSKTKILIYERAQNMNPNWLKEDGLNRVECVVL